jgi:predicted ribosome quality control (RQC) complex YloA/Tae2 family protein
MTLDGLTLNYIVEELKDVITDYKVDKVHQPQPDTIVLSLRAPGKSPKLLISAGAFDSRMHLTEQKYVNPQTPPMFCMFLRKHLTGAKITDITQTGLERIVSISLEAKDELGHPRPMTLVAELMGKYSNVILIDNGIIMDSLRHVTRTVSRVRCVLPSLPYEDPQSTKLNPLTISRPTLVEMLQKKGDAKIKTYLSAFLQGISGQTATEILHRYMPEGYEPHPREAEKLADIIISFFEEPTRPTMYLRGGVPFFYAPKPFLSIAADETIGFDSVDALTDAYYYRLRQLETLGRKRDALHRVVSKQLDKLIHTRQKQQTTMEQAKKAEEYKTRGDLITANIYRISRGQQTLVAQDYMTGENVAIELDSRLSPAANAQQQYKKYNKLRQSLDITASRMAQTSSDIAFLESVQVSIDASETSDELAEIEYELAKAGFMPKKHAAVRATQAPSQPHRFVSSDGLTILAGKNNRQNDLLTMKTAAPDDIWLHTKDIPGAHVLITGAKGEAPDTTLIEAATIAASLSKAKGGAKVAVDYAPRKNVRKPNGAKPGMVIYEGYNTILVSPDKTLFDKLLVSKSEQ